MSPSDLFFASWWYGSGIVLATAAWTGMRRGGQVDYELVLRVLLVGIAAALALFLIPNGVASIDSPTDFKLRMLAALAIAWAAGVVLTRPLPHAESRPAVALAAFIGVNAPPLALVLSATMV